MYKELKSLTKSSSIYVIFGFINALVPLILIPVLTRYLTPSEYGIVGFYIMLMTAFSSLSALGAEGAATRKYFDENIKPEEIAQFVGSCFLILGATLFFMMIIALLLTGITSFFIGLDLIWVVAAVIAGGCMMTLQLASGQAQVRKKPILFGVLQLLYGVSNLSISILLVVSYKYGAEGRMFGIFISYIMMFFISLFILRRFKWMKLSYRPDYIREALNFGIPLLPHSVALIILAMADRYLIGVFLDFKDLGIYILAMQIAAVLSIFFNSFHNAFTPWLYAELKKKDIVVNSGIVFFTYGYIVVFILFGFVSLAFSPQIVRMLAGNPEYYYAGELIPFLIFSQILTGFYLMHVGYLLYEKRTKLLSAITLSSAILNIVLIIVLIGSYGIKGVAIASVSAMLFRFITIWFYSNKVHPMPWINFLKTTKV